MSLDEVFHSIQLYVSAFCYRFKSTITHLRHRCELKSKSGFSRHLQDSVHGRNQCSRRYCGTQHKLLGLSYHTKCICAIVVGIVTILIIATKAGYNGLQLEQSAENAFLPKEISQNSKLKTYAWIHDLLQTPYCRYCVIFVCKQCGYTCTCSRHTTHSALCINRQTLLAIRDVTNSKFQQR